MKGQAEPIDLIGIAAVIVVIVLISAVFQRNTIFEALHQVATYTGPAVARDIGGLMTMTAAAPGDIDIKYYQNAKFSYSLDMHDHTTDIIITKGMQNGEEIKGSSETLPSLKKSLTNCNKFLMSKKGGQYDVSC
ncbi:hypothetical protein EPN87_02615, partial [archaeon]